MSYILFLAGLMTAFYIGATQLALNQLQHLEQFYANVDEIAQSVAGAPHENN